MKKIGGETAINYAQRLNHAITRLRNEDYRNYAALRKELLSDWLKKAKAAGGPDLMLTLDDMRRANQDWEKFGLEGESHKNYDSGDTWHGHVSGKLSGIARFLFKECKDLEPFHADDMLQEAFRDLEEAYLDR